MYRCRKGSKDGSRPPFDPRSIEQGHAVERGINRIERRRSVVHRQVKPAAWYKADGHITATNEWL